MSSGESFQISLSAAETYERSFVPALFAEWAPLLVDAAGVQPGHAVLDVACGTGIVARTAAMRAGAAGVVGLDLNDAMLTVARRVAPALTWRQGDCAALPFPDRTFDSVLCQMALMFFPDRVAALGEMGRVAAQGATVGLVVPAGLDAQPAYREFVEVAARHVGAAALSLLGTYWACGDVDDLTAWCDAANLEVVALTTHMGTAQFSSSDELVATEINASPLAHRIDPDTYEHIRSDSAHALAAFTRADGTFAPPLVGHILTAVARLDG